MRETPSHQGMQALGWERFSELAGKVGVPAHALGGITQDDLSMVTEHAGFGRRESADFSEYRSLGHRIQSGQVARNPMSLVCPFA